MAASTTRKWWQRKRWISLIVVVVGMILLARTDAAASLIEAGRKPAKPFAETPAPPAPDYAEGKAWLAFPGRNGLERSTTPGVKAVDEKTAPADVFFIHPTMYLKNDVWNAPYDVAGAYNAPVLLAQASAFNGCCLIYAPHYRQASLTGLKNVQAVALAYSDVARAFRYYIEHLNHGRPFIIASHSQGTGHAVRLLQEEIAGKPLQARMVAAYTIGAYTPASFATIGLPTCNVADQTGCVISWNAAQKGRRGPELLTKKSEYWWQGKQLPSSGVPAVCVNPLTWTEKTGADASANVGALSFPKAPYPSSATTLPALVPTLTGSVCNDGLLDVDIPWTSDPHGFRDTLTLLYGSFHRNDYGLFYANIRANAVDRVSHWRPTAAAAPTTGQ
jgi:hypothetical protein